MMTMQACGQDVPMPVVTLNRVVIVASIVGGLALGQPLVTTALFVVVTLATLFGRRASLVYQVGSRLFRARCERAMGEGRWEDRRLMRFNNAIAASMLGLAQLAFVAGMPVVGWALAGVVAVAASVALAGFCLGCFLFTQIRLASVARARG